MSLKVLCAQAVQLGRVQRLLAQRRAVLARQFQVLHRAPAIAHAEQGLREPEVRLVVGRLGPQPSRAGDAQARALSATSRHPIGRKIATSTTGMSAQPPYAGSDSKVLHHPKRSIEAPPLHQSHVPTMDEYHLFRGWRGRTALPDAPDPDVIKLLLGVLVVSIIPTRSRALLSMTELNMQKDCRPLNCLPVLLSGLLLTVACGAEAGLVATSAAGYAEPHTDSITTVYGPTATVSSVSINGPLGTVAATGSAAASYGALHSGSTSVVGGDGQARGGATSAWIDNVTLSSSHIGAATGRATFDLSGALNSRVGGTSTAAFANSTVGVSVTVGGVQVLNIGAQLLHRNSSNSAYDIDTVSVSGLNVSFTQGSLAGLYSFDMPFTLGTSFVLAATLTAETRAFGSSGVDDVAANSDFASTGTWGGISSVHLSDGTVVSDLSVGSDSGFDWSHAYSAVLPPVPAVPEPGTFALFMAGLGLTGCAVRRRARM